MKIEAFKGHALVRHVTGVLVAGMVMERFYEDHGKIFRGFMIRDAVKGEHFYAADSCARVIPATAEIVRQKQFCQFPHDDTQYTLFRPPAGMKVEFSDPPEQMRMVRCPHCSGQNIFRITGGRIEDEDTCEHYQSHHFFGTGRLTVDFHWCEEDSVSVAL